MAHDTPMILHNIQPVKDRNTTSKTSFTTSPWSLDNSLSYRPKFTSEVRAYLYFRNQFDNNEC